VVKLTHRKGIVMKTNNSLQYKGYSGTITYSEEDGVFHGKVAGIKSLISFEGDSVNLMKKNFNNAVDEYLEFCKENYLKPEKPIVIQGGIREKMECS